MLLWVDTERAKERKKERKKGYILCLQSMYIMHIANLDPILMYDGGRRGRTFGGGRENSMLVGGRNICLVPHVTTSRRVDG